MNTFTTTRPPATVWQPVDKITRVRPRRFHVRVLPFNTITFRAADRPAGEKFRRGAFRRAIRSDPILPVTARHAGPTVGHATEWQEYDDGLHCEISLLDSPSGDAAATLIAANTAEFSVGFVGAQSSTDADGVRVVEHAWLDHVALVGATLGPAAYPNTGVLEARAATPTSTPDRNGWRETNGTLWRPAP